MRGNRSIARGDAGRITGVWDEDPKRGIIKYYLSQDLPATDEESVRHRLRAMGEFLFDDPAAVHRSEHMKPLTERTMGSMMSPLRDS